MEPPCCTSYPNQPPVSLFQGTCQERDSREFLELQSKSATIYREPGILCLMFICLLVCFPLCVGGWGQRSKFTVFLNHWPPYSWDGISHWTQSSLIKLDRPARELREPLLLPLQVWDCRCITTVPGIFMQGGGVGVWTQVLVFAQQATQSSVSSPQIPTNSTESWCRPWKGRSQSEMQKEALTPCTSNTHLVSVCYLKPIVKLKGKYENKNTPNA